MRSSPALWLPHVQPFTLRPRAMHSSRIGCSRLSGQFFNRAHSPLTLIFTLDSLANISILKLQHPSITDRVSVANGYRPNKLLPWQYDDPDGLLFICENLYKSPNSTTKSHKSWKRSLSMTFRRVFRETPPSIETKTRH